MFGPRLWTAALVLALAVAGCTTPSTAPSTSSASTTDGSAAVSASPSPAYGLGRFPELLDGPLPEATTAALQAVLDTAVEDGTFVGVTATVILADQGSWTGAAGSWDEAPLTPDSRHPTHSSAKTIVAAQVLALSDDGRLDLDDPASERLPPELEFFDANGATIRQVLAMRSGIPSLNEGAGYYPAEQASSVVEVFQKLDEPTVPPDTETEYASTNYVLLGAIVEHATGLPLAEAVRSDVLAQPGLEDIVYTVENALASDGWGVEATPSALARWGYALYGGSVISEASLREMTDFRGSWYGLGAMDFSEMYGVSAVGHQGLSSVTTCCSAIILLALPEEGLVIAVQANTVGTDPSVDTNGQVDRLARALRDATQE